MRTKFFKYVPLSISVFSLVFAIFMAIPAHAATTNNAIDSSISESIGASAVYDQPDLFSEQEEANIMDAIKSLNDTTGVEARVIVLNNIGSYGNLDMYFSDLIDQTPVLQSPNGGLKTNLMVLVMSYEDRNRGIYYVETGTLKNAFQHDPELSALQADYMIPEFQAGNFAQGFIGTINEVERVIDNYLHPPATTTPVVEDNPVVNEPTKSNFSPIIFLFILLGIGLVALLVYVGYLLIRRYQRIVFEREEAEEARKNEHSEAQKACTKAMKEFVPFSDPEFENVLAKKVKKYVSLDPSKKNELEGHLGTYRMNWAEYASTFASSEKNNGNVSYDNLPISSYSNMIRAYTFALTKAETIKEATERIVAICEEIDQHIDFIPRLIEICENMEAKTSEQLAYVAEHELKTPDFTKEIETLSANLSKQKIAKRTIPNLNALQKIERSFEKVIKEVSVIVDQDKKLSSDIPKCEDDIKTAKATLSSVKKVFDDLAKHYAESSWDSVSGNGSEAELQIKNCEKFLAQTKAQYVNKSYEGALDLLSQAQKCLENADSLLSAIKKRRDDLASYKKQAPTEFDLAETDIKKAEDYLQSYKEGLNYRMYRADIDDAINDLKMAREEFAKPLPDYDKVIELALEANHDADRVLENCINEVEQLKRLRHQVAETLKKAQGDIDEARRYIKNHSSDVKSGVSDLLSQAEHSIRIASDFDDPTRELDETRKACDLIAEALKKAKNDVKKAEDTREEERRRQRRREEEETRRRNSYHHTTIISSSNSSSSFGGSSFGGSSGGFSSGSTSFGGSSGKW